MSLLKYFESCNKTFSIDLFFGLEFRNKRVDSILPPISLSHD